MVIVFFINVFKVNKNFFVYYFIFNFKYICIGKCFVINLNDFFVIVFLREKGRKFVDWYFK